MATYNIQYNTNNGKNGNSAPPKMPGSNQPDPELEQYQKFKNWYSQEKESEAKETTNWPRDYSNDKSKDRRYFSSRNPYSRMYTGPQRPGPRKFGTPHPRSSPGLPRHMIDLADKAVAQAHNLTAYLDESKRPRHHPSDRELKELAIGEVRRTNGYTYVKVDWTNVVIVGQSSHVTDGPGENNGKFLFQTDPVMFVKDLSKPHNALPSPKMPLAWLMQDRLFLAANYTTCNHHRMCKCAPLSAEIHQEFVTSPVCLHEHYVRKEDMMSMPNGQLESFHPNPSRVYKQGPGRSGKPLLQVPQPHLNAFSWKSLPYFPAMATEPSDQRMSVFYGLHDTQRHLDTVWPFLKNPQTWTKREHPWGGEPHLKDELSLWSRKLYGSESLFRVLYPAHPAAGREIPIFSVMTTDGEVPVIIESSDLSCVAKYLKAHLYPFYRDGMGQVTCPVCLFKEVDGRMEQVLLTRNKFMGHFESLHMRNVHFIALGFSTAYNSRLNEAYLLYTMALCHIPEDSPKMENPEEYFSQPAWVNPQLGIQAGFGGHLRGWSVASRKYFQPIVPEATISSEDMQHLNPFSSAQETLNSLGLTVEKKEDDKEETLESLAAQLEDSMK